MHDRASVPVSSQARRDHAPGMHTNRESRAHPSSCQRALAGSGAWVNPLSIGKPLTASLFYV